MPEKTRSSTTHSASTEGPRVGGVVDSWGLRLFETHAPPFPLLVPYLKQVLISISPSTYHKCRGGDLGGQGGRSPPKNLRWGDGPCIGPPNILRSSVVGWARKLEERKK